MKCSPESKIWSLGRQNQPSKIATKINNKQALSLSCLNKHTKINNTMHTLLITSHHKKRQWIPITSHHLKKVLTIHHIKRQRKCASMAKVLTIHHSSYPKFVLINPRIKENLAPQRKLCLSHRKPWPEQLHYPHDGTHKDKAHIIHTYNRHTQQKTSRIAKVEGHTLTDKYKQADLTSALCKGLPFFLPGGKFFWMFMQSIIPAPGQEIQRHILTQAHMQSTTHISSR